VSTFAYDLSLTLLPHLAHPSRHPLLLPLMESLVPLLLVDRAGPVAQQHKHQHLYQQQHTQHSHPTQQQQHLHVWQGREIPSTTSNVVQGKGHGRGSGEGQLGVRGRGAGGLKDGLAEGWGREVGEALVYKWKTLMQAVAAALVPNLAMARSESPAVVQVRGEGNL